LKFQVVKARNSSWKVRATPSVPLEAICGGEEEGYFAPNELPPSRETGRQLSAGCVPWKHPREGCCDAGSDRKILRDQPSFRPRLFPAFTSRFGGEETCYSVNRKDAGSNPAGSTLFGDWPVAQRQSMRRKVRKGRPGLRSRLFPGTVKAFRTARNTSGNTSLTVVKRSRSSPRAKCWPGLVPVQSAPPPRKGRARDFACSPSSRTSRHEQVWGEENRYFACQARGRGFESRQVQHSSVIGGL